MRPDSYCGVSTHRLVPGQNCLINQHLVYMGLNKLM